MKKRNARKRSREENPDKVNEDERLERKRSKSSDRPLPESDSSRPGLNLENDLNTEGILVGESAAEHDDAENADNTELEMQDAGPSDVRMMEASLIFFMFIFMCFLLKSLFLILFNISHNLSCQDG